jgi:hypothetical protein
MTRKFYFVSINSHRNNLQKISIPRIASVEYGNIIINIKSACVGYKPSSYFVHMSRVLSGTKQKNSIFPFLPWMS